MRIFGPGQHALLSHNGRDGFYYINEGYAKITYQREDAVELIRILGPHDLAGFARWLSSEGQHGLITLSRVTASFSEKETFNGILRDSPYLANEVVRWMMLVLISQEERIFSLKHSTARSRVASALEILRRRFGEPFEGEGLIIAAPVDRKTLADLAGVANEVLSRVLRKFEDEGIIDRRGRKIVILDPKSLGRVALLKR